MAYTELRRRLVQDRLQELQETKAPAFVVGTPNQRMRKLLARHTWAERELARTNKALQRYGVTVEQRRGHDPALVLRYDRKQRLEAEWRRKHDARIAAVKRLDTEAQLAMLSLSAKDAATYLRNLQRKLKAI
jgi:hypothetical protein